MNYLAGLLGGVASNVIFWFLQTNVLELEQQTAVVGAIICFLLFGLLGFWLSSSAGKRSTSADPAGVRVGSGLKGRNVKVKARQVAGTPGTPTDVGTDIVSDGDVDIDAKDIKG